MSVDPRTDPWGSTEPPATSPEEFARVMAVFDEIQRGYDREWRALSRKLARKRAALGQGAAVGALGVEGGGRARPE